MENDNMGQAHIGHLTSWGFQDPEDPIDCHFPQRSEIMGEGGGWEATSFRATKCEQSFLKKPHDVKMLWMFFNGDPVVHNTTNSPQQN